MHQNDANKEMTYLKEERKALYGLGLPTPLHAMLIQPNATFNAQTKTKETTPIHYYSVHEFDWRPCGADVSPHSLLCCDWALNALHRIRSKQLGGFCGILDRDRWQLK